MTERNLPAGLKTSLLANAPYSYFHLVKFEKPRPSAGSGQTSGKATDYAYITDASINIGFDDESRDSRGTLNQEQVYVANKLLSVGTVSETTEARASSMSLTLSGTALGTIIIANVSFTAFNMTADIDLLDAGFQEGDTLLLETSLGVNNNKYIRINTFTNNNQTVLFTPIDTTITDEAAATSYTLSYASEEVNSLILNKIGATNYSTYINREVFIYRAHMSPETGEIFGKPFLIFRGIIANGAVSDNMLTTSKVTWSLTSHWGDFVRVQGRQTSDSQHRALSITGQPDIDALIRPEYAQDPGFIHAESSINVMAQYQTLEQKFRMRKRGGFAGLFGGQKMLEYTELVDKEIDLQFNLEAKYLPVVYGVQKVDSFPIFADIVTAGASSGTTEVYIAHAICEGEISGILDVHIDDTTTICLDASDADVRSVGGGGSVPIACYGRADRGFILRGSGFLGEIIEFDPGETPFGGQNNLNVSDGPVYVQLDIDETDIDTAGSGLQHEAAFHFTSPIDMTLFIHTGKPYQNADNLLVGLARAKSFKIQQDYYLGAPGDYWSPSHRVLDTAYVVGKYTIREGEVTIPKLEFVVKGSKLECFNYDYSYQANTIQPDGTEEDFLLGDTVTLHHTNTNIQIGSSVSIIDKWSFYDENNQLSHRFRFSENPQAIPSVSSFYMKNAAGDRKWYMTTYNALEVERAVLGTQPSYEVASAALNATGIWLNLFLVNPLTSQPYVYGDSVVVTFPGVDATASFIFTTYSQATKQFSVANTGAASQTIIDNIAKGLTATIRPLNYITLDGRESPDDVYNNKNLTITRYNSNGDIIQEVTRKIIDFNGTTKIAKLDSPLPVSFIPNSTTDEYKIESTGDKRVSINPAIQLLDYLTSTRYGKGLKYSDLNIDTFLESARYCDTRSDVTVQVPAGITVSIDAIYKYEVEGALAFQGKVKSVVPNGVTVSGGTTTTYQEVTFTEVIGKLAYKWNNWKSFPLNYPIWNNGAVYLGTGSIQTTTPSASALSSLSLTKVEGTGATSLPLSITDGFTSSGNPIIKKFTNSLEGFNSPGYSLYDSDDVKYWSYLGWDEAEQRYVTRHQTNQVINTSSPLFDNINSMLIQFNGIMRYSNGKYELDIKRAAPTEFESFQVITEEDIFGELKVSDKGQKNSYNSMETTIIDPQNKFSGRGIKFFNSTYLKEDKGIRRAGNFAMPGISNYYNARINIKQYLDTSRFGLDISFTIDSKGYLLLAGTIIKLSYSRFGWDNKPFRVENLNFNTNGLVQVTASEHNDEAFLIGNIKGSVASQVLEETGGASNQNASNTPVSPSNLQATTNAKGGITVTWVNSDNFKASTHYTEVHASTTNNRASSSLVAITQSNTFIDIIVTQQLVTKYYWVRHVVSTADNRQLVSEYFPLNETAGVEGSATGAIDGLNTATVFIYQRTDTNTAPTDLPVGDTVYTFSSGATTFANANGWSRDVPSTGGAYLWVSQATAASITSTDTITDSEWATATRLAEDGTKTALVYLYQRSASALTNNAGDVVVDLNTGLIVTESLANGWLREIPQGTDPLYIIVASAAGTGATDTILAAEWSDPVVLSQNGLNTATVFIYQRTDTNTAPTDLPVGDTVYTFSSGATTFANANGWSRDVPSTGGAYLWVSQATAASITSTDTITASEWATPSRLAEDGPIGATGPRTATGYVYYQVASATEPTPPPTATSYSFSEGTFGGLTANWGISAPTFVAGNTNKYWYSTYTVVESVFGGTQTRTFGTVTQGIGFTGLVTFTGSNLTDGANTYNPATVVNGGDTTIDGGKITTNSIDAAQLKISSDSSIASSMFFDGVNNRIDIKDASGTLRVRIGNLA